MDKELSASMKKLNKENRSIIMKMETYLESHYVNEVSCEDILSDIVGMALECQERNESFLSAIGDDSESFCRELIRNVPRQSVWERIFDVLRWLFLYAAILLPGMYLIEILFSKWSPADIDGLLYTVRLSFILKYYIFTFILVAGWFIVRMFTYKPTKYVFGIYLGVFMLFFLFTDAALTFLIGDRIVTLNPLVIACIFGVLTVLCDLIRRLVAFTVAYRKRKNDMYKQNQ